MFDIFREDIVSNVDSTPVENFFLEVRESRVACIMYLIIRMNSTKVQNPRRKMQVALLAEPKTPPRVERVYIIL